MAPTNELVEKLARSYQEFLKKMTTPAQAWYATINQYTDLRKQSAEDQKALLFEVKKFMREETFAEKNRAQSEAKKPTDTASESLRKPTESWGIGKGLLSEPEIDSQQAQRLQYLRELDQKLAKKKELAEQAAKEAREKERTKKGDEQFELFKPSLR